MEAFTAVGKETALEKLVTGKCKRLDSVVISIQKSWLVWSLFSFSSVEIGLKRELALKVGSTERDKKKKTTTCKLSKTFQP